MSLNVYINNDNSIVLDNLKNTSTDAYDNAATVTCDILDRGTTSIIGSPLISMAHVSESPDEGKYRGTIPAATTLYPAQQYVAVISVTGSGGETAQWKLRVRPLERSV